VSCDAAIYVGTSNQAIKDPWPAATKKYGKFPVTYYISNPSREEMLYLT
jgi:hypothetical protein